MMSRMFAGSFGNSFWLCHQSTIPQLLTLSVSVGTGGDHIPVMTRSGGGFEILTRPVVFTEKTEKLGDLGDIMLIDASQYVVGLRSEMRFDTSIHVAFVTDEILARLSGRDLGSVRTVRTPTGAVRLGSGPLKSRRLRTKWVQGPRRAGNGTGGLRGGSPSRILEEVTGEGTKTAPY
jgi:hypothetical protein